MRRARRLCPGCPRAIRCVAEGWTPRMPVVLECTACGQYTLGQWATRVENGYLQKDRLRCHRLSAEEARWMLRHRIKREFLADWACPYCGEERERKSNDQQGAKEDRGDRPEVRA